MATLHISDSLDSRLQAEARRQGSSVEDVIGVLLDISAEETVGEPPLTEAQLRRIQESSAQALRGETVSAEEVDEIFEEFFRSLDSRKNAA